MKRYKIYSRNELKQPLLESLKTEYENKNRIYQKSIKSFQEQEEENKKLVIHEEPASLSLDFLNDRINKLKMLYNDLQSEIIRQTLNLNITIRKILFNIDEQSIEKGEKNEQ